MRIAAACGLFQAVMPVLGWFTASIFKDFTVSYNKWIAFAILAGVGGKMIYEGLREEKDGDSSFNPLSTRVLFTLALATSLDAFAVGISLSCLGHGSWTAATMIGVVTLIISFVGTQIGKSVGHFFENRFECVGGLVLIGIGVKILLF